MPHQPLALLSASLLLGATACFRDDRGHAPDVPPACDFDEHPPYLALAAESLPRFRDLLQLFLGDGTWLVPGVAAETASAEMEKSVRSHFTTSCTTATATRDSPSSFRVDFGSICQLDTLPNDLVSGSASAMVTSDDAGKRYLDFGMALKAGPLTFDGGGSIEIADPTACHFFFRVATDDMPQEIDFRFDGSVRPVDGGYVIDGSGLPLFGSNAPYQCELHLTDNRFDVVGLHRDSSSCHADAGRLTFAARFDCCPGAVPPSGAIDDVIDWSVATNASSSVQLASTHDGDAATTTSVSIFHCAPP